MGSNGLDSLEPKGQRGKTGAGLSVQELLNSPWCMETVALYREARAGF